jgi:hypothetical protein
MGSAITSIVFPAGNMSRKHVSLSAKSSIGVLKTMNTPSTVMFRASPSNDPLSVIIVTGHRTSVRGDFRSSTKVLNALYLTGFFGLGIPQSQSSQVSTRSAFLRDEIFGRLLAMGKKG